MARTKRNERNTSKRAPQFLVGISEKWLYHLPSIRNFRNFLSNGKHPNDFDFYFRWGFVENRKAWSNSLTNTMTFFFLYVSGSGRDSHFEMFSGPDFEESYPNIGPCCSADKSALFWLCHVKLYYRANQIWHVCNNLLDAMVQMPHGNCFSWLKRNSQTLRGEKTLKQPMVNNETIMLSERASLLIVWRDIRFGTRFLAKNVVSFSFTLDWFLFLHFFSSTGKKKT